MATVNFVQTGDSIDYTPATAVDAGDVIVQNDLIGVASVDIAASALGALAVTGVFDFPKDTGSASAIAAGKTVYWDENNEVATETAGGNTSLGKSVKAAGDDDTTVRVRLSQ
jgi:predicted RecA/RadA family phage recombinase